MAILPHRRPRHRPHSSLQPAPARPTSGAGALGDAAPAIPAAPPAHRAAQPAAPSAASPITVIPAPPAALAVDTQAGPVDASPAPVAAPAITSTPIAAPAQPASSPATAAVDPLAVAGTLPPTVAQPLHPTEAPAPAPTPGAAPAHQVAAALVQITHSPSGSAVTLRLDPAELGHVQIRIERGADGTATVHVSAERPETLRLLIADQPQLHRTLDSAGLPQEGRSLTLSLAAPDASTNSATDRGAGSNTGTGSGGFSKWRRHSAGRRVAAGPRALFRRRQRHPSHEWRLAAGRRRHHSLKEFTHVRFPHHTDPHLRGQCRGHERRLQRWIGHLVIHDECAVIAQQQFHQLPRLLLTQLQNQDPSSPMDTNTFTSELVQFSSVEQQITTNSSLTSLIQATQGSEVIQATGVVGKSVTVDSSQVALQNGSGQLNYSTNSAEPVNITISNSSGTTVRQVSLTSTAGSNTYTWDGTDSSGTALADGAYKVSIAGTGSDGTTAAVPFTVTGKATGVTNTNGAVTLQVGGLSVDFSKVVSVASGS